MQSQFFLSRRGYAAHFRATFAIESLECRQMLTAIFSTVATFDGSNGISPGGQVLSGNTLYGTTFGDGENDGEYGTIFSVPVTGGSPTTLVNFNGTNGNEPEDLVLSGNMLYGATESGGADEDGNLFSVPITGGAPKTLATFDGTNGSSPGADLILVGKKLFGVTTGGDGGPDDDGTIFSIPIIGGAVTTLATFSGGNGDIPTGYLTLSGKTLYGMTTAGGADDDGTVFSVPITGGTITTLATFDGTNGDEPEGSLILSGNTLIGTTSSGGAYGEGNVFSVPVTGGSPTTLALFNGTNGSFPTARLALFGRTLYGTTVEGGFGFDASDPEDNPGDGTVFSLPITGGAPTTLVAFNGANGSEPLTGVIADASGNLFGTDVGDEGEDNFGTDFKISLGTNPALPSVLDIAANLCLDTYSSEPVGFGGYRFLEDDTDEDKPNLGYLANVYATANDGDIIIAIRGTDPDDGLLTLFKNVVADVSFGGNTPSSILSTEVSDAAKLVADVAGDYPNSDITLTGHSLGGAVAQLIGQASGLTTYAFNAPGAEQLYEPLTTQLAPVSGLEEESDGINANYRIYGDQVSLFGQPFDQVVTFDKPAGIAFSPATNSASDFAKYASTYLSLHSIKTVISQLALPAPEVSPNGEPNDAKAIEDEIQTSSTTSTVNGGSIIQFIAVKVLSFIANLFDPSPAAGYSFTEQTGSPDFSGVTLPTVTGVAEYQLTTVSGGKSVISVIQPGVSVTLPASTTAIDFIPMDSAGAAVDADVSLFSLSFTASGTFTGSLTETTSTTQTAVATKLVFAKSPTSTVAGTKISPAVVVDVENASGKIVTSDNSMVTISLASGPGALGGTPTAKAVDGIATFSSLLLTAVGSYTLKAADGSLTSATSGSFTITPAAAAKLVFATGPTTTVAGKAISPTVVHVEDAYGNLVTTTASDVTISVVSGDGTLTGTETAAAKAGVATFSNLVLTRAGSFTLKAADGSLTTATSGSFTVTPAAAAKLVFTKPPVSGKMNTVLSSIAASIEDAFGNIVTTDKSTITISIANGPTGAVLSGTTVLTAAGGLVNFTALKLNKSGTYTLKLIDGKLSSAISTPFSIS